MRATAIVAVGGAVGASGRWAAGELVPSDRYPWATLLVNVAGCVAIGLAARRWVRGSDRWLGAVVGVLGGLTTFSAFAVECRQLVADGRTVAALTYIVASVGGGLLATELAVAGSPHTDRTEPKVPVA